MVLKVTNNAFGTLNGGISSSATSITLSSGDGAKFPSLSSPDVFYATLIDTSNNTEIVKVTARSTDSLTVVRAQDNTTARAFSAGDRFELRPTAVLFEAFHQKDNDITAKTSDGAELNLQTSDTTIGDGDSIGAINFAAPDEASGTDAILTAAAIVAEADATFAADNNQTDLVFKLGSSEAATEKMRLEHEGNLVLSGNLTAVNFTGSGDITAKTSDGAELNLQTSETTVVDGDILGSINFKAPDEASGTDAIITGASIIAESDSTFAADNNGTDIVFKLGNSGAPVERFRIRHDAGILAPLGSAGLSGLPKIQAGNTTVYNLAIDANTVQARNNGAASSFYLQYYGGLTQIGNYHTTNRVTVRCNYDGVSGGGGTGGTALYVTNDGNNTNRYGVTIQSGTDDGSGTSYPLLIRDGDANYIGGLTFSGSTVSYQAFSAGHEASIPNADNPTDVNTNAYPYGTLVEIKNVFYTQKNGKDSERGIRYNVQKAATKYSRKVLGTYTGTMNNHPDAGSNPNLHQIGVLGDSHIICNNEGGSISIGDGICVSSVAGIGMKADKMCMCIGIAQEDVTFSGSETKLVTVQLNLQQFTPWTD